MNSRNGYRVREWDTRAGTIDLVIRKLSSGSYFPDWPLTHRRRAEQALVSVVATSYLLGWRCRTHHLRNLLTKVPKSAQPWIATLVRTISASPTLMPFRAPTRHRAARPQSGARELGGQRVLGTAEICHVQLPARDSEQARYKGCHARLPRLAAEEVIRTL